MIISEVDVEAHSCCDSNEHFERTNGRVVAFGAEVAPDLTPQSGPLVDDIDGLLRRVQPLVVRRVRCRLGTWSDDVRDDVVQACLIHLWRYVLPGYDPARGPLDPFVRLCLDRVIHREHLKLQRQVHTEPLPDDLPADDLPADDEDLIRRRRIEEDIVRHPERYLNDREVQLLRLALQGHQPRQIGPMLGISPASVSQALYRLRKKLRGLSMPPSDRLTS